VSDLAQTEAAVPQLLRDRSRGQRVTNIELFFDLVYVFAVTHSPSPRPRTRPTSSEPHWSQLADQSPIDEYLFDSAYINGVDSGYGVD
jgi:hypothetical protein